MGYFLIEDFSQGLDLRKLPINAKPGSLRSLKNAFINPGGEIEKRVTVTSVGTVPATTFGVGFHGDKVVVFGTDVSAGGTLPSYVEYRQLIPTGGGVTISKILDVSPYSDKLYVIARMSDSSVRHFLVSGTTGAQVAGVTGTNARTHRTKTYVVDGRNLRFSAVNTPSDFAGTGSGLIDVASQDVAMPDLVGIEVYYSFLALFGRTSVQTWAMDVDPDKNSLVQVLGNIGLVAPNAVAQYGSGDLLFLSHTGIRSLRARDSSNAAVLSDIGAAIDPLIQAKRATLTNSDAENIRAIVDPLSGQFWLIWGNQIHVLAYYPNSKISAWATYELPVSVNAVTLANSRIVIRSGNELFVYGSVPPTGSPWDPNAPTGNSAALYDETSVEVITPFIDLGKPATPKTWTGFDLGAEGTWTVDICINPPVQTQTPENPNSWLWTTVGTNVGSSFDLAQLGFDVTSNHLAFRFRSVGAGPAKLGKIGLHFAGEGFAS